MSDTYELKAAMLAAKENSDLPVMATVIFGENGKMLTGATPEAVTALLEGLGADAFGMNCGLGPKQMKPIFERLAKSASIPLIINPNAGLPRSENGKTVFDVDPSEFAEDMKIFAEEGAWLMGGCCGTTPAHIKALVEACKDAMPKPLTDKNLTLVSSYSHAVELGKMPMLIGERINPTGKSKFKQALRDRNMEYILEMGVKQSDAGAQILDVNVGLPEINEPELMKETVYQLQSILDAPLQIDTTNIAVNRQNALAYCLNKDYPTAIQRYEYLVSQGDSSFHTCYYLGISYYAEEKYYEAHDFLEAARKHDPENVNLLYYLGRACAKTSWKKSGVEYLEKAIDLSIPKDSNMTRLYIGMTDCYKMAEMPKEQIESIRERYRKYDKQNHKLLYDMAFIYFYSLKDKKNTERCLEAFLKTRPKEDKEEEAKLNERGELVLGTKNYYNAAANWLKDIQSKQKIEDFFLGGNVPAKKTE